MSSDLLIKLDVTPILNYVSKFALTESGFNSINNSNFDQSFIESKTLQDITQELKDYLITSGEIPLKYYSSIPEILKKLKIEGVRLNPNELKQILILLINSRSIYKIFYNNTKFKSLSELVKNVKVNTILERSISDVINENDEILDTASPELFEIRTKIKRVREEIIKISERILNKLYKEGITQENYYTIRDGRLVLPIKSEFKRNLKGFIHSESSSGATTYVEPAETLELNNDLLSLYFQENREIDKILFLLTINISKYFNDLLIAENAVTEIDIAQAKAKYALEINANKVIFSNGEIRIYDCRHPLLIKKFGIEKTIPFSLSIDKSIRCLVVSGPNAGGKTVFMKAIGLISLLSKAGFQIPFKPDSTIPFFENIFIDIGDEQSIESDISTFSSHIENLNRINDNLTENSLILIDELGMGTDPKDGVALGAGIIKHFVKKGCFCVVTTHHSGLKIFASNNKGILNCSMQFNVNTLEPSYKFIQGIAGSSFAFDIAKKKKLDNNILSLANSFRDAIDIKIENYLNELQRQSEYYINLIEEVKKNKKYLEKEYEKIESTKKELKQKELELKRKDLENSFTFLKESKSLIEKAIKEIKESNADSAVIKNVKKDIEKLSSQIKDTKDRISLNRDDLKGLEIGDYVKAINSNIKGRIIEINKNNNYVVILDDTKKIKVSSENLIKTSEENETHYLNKTKNEINFNKNIQLNIIGKRVSEIDNELIKYLDEMGVSGVKYVEIIHGKGNGILKDYVRKILHSHPFVETFGPAAIEFGGDGKTIVKFKEI